MTTNIRGSDNFDTALYPPDVSPNAWHIALGSTTAFTVTDSTLTFDTVVHKGGNLTLDGGKITVSVAGMYLISFAGSRYQTTDDVWDWSIGLNSGEIANTRAYVAGNNAGNYDSTSITVPVQLAAGDVVFIQGKGYCYGTPSNGMTFFTGVRLGV
tara:strand:- start:18 stop:482 length:465 start_codon:yes stop_codon:yes gene_type:complete